MTFLIPVARKARDTKSGLWHETEEVSFYGCQAALPAAKIGAAIRAHWGIENRNHHVRDVSFFEDSLASRPAAQVQCRLLSALRPTEWHAEAARRRVDQGNVSDAVDRKLGLNAKQNAP